MQWALIRPPAPDQDEEPHHEDGRDTCSSTQEISKDVAIDRQDSADGQMTQSTSVAEETKAGLALAPIASEPLDTDTPPVVQEQPAVPAAPVPHSGVEESTGISTDI
jgi:hypothetical protein